MAIVNALRFGRDSGAIISDQECWYLGTRKTFFTDNLTILLPDEVYKSVGVQVAYGGSGAPDFHNEVILRFQDKLEDLRNTSGVEKHLGSVNEVGRMVLTAVRETIRRRASDRLRYLYNFTADDLVQGFFTRGNEKIEIRQKWIKEDALKTIQNITTSASYIPYNHICLLGYDPKSGCILYCIKSEISVLSLVSNGFESLGPGRYAGGISFADFLNERNLSTRREGMAPVEGMAVLLRCGLEACDHFGQVGTHFNIIILEKGHYREIFDTRAHLACEVVRAYMKDIITQSQAHGFIEKLLFEEADLHEVEDKLFCSAKDPVLLDLVLRGYKNDQSIPKGEPCLPVLEKLKSKNIGSCLDQKASSTPKD